MIKKGLLSTVFFLSLLTSYSSHIVGGFIDVECIGNNEYLVTLGLYEDCATAFAPNNPQNVNLDNSCGLPTTTFSLPNTVYQQPMNVYCSNFSGLCGGPADLFYHEWQDTISIGTCSSWELSHTACCYGTMTNISGQPGYYYSSSFDNTNNCIETVNAQNLSYPTACVGSNYCYNPEFTVSAYDSVVYSLEAAESQSGVAVTYNSGYSGSNPMSGISIDPATGEICVIPNMAGNFLINTVANEYENGVLIASTTHTISLNVINCTGTNDQPSFDGVNNLSPSASLTGNQMDVCAGDSLCFDLDFSDINANDTLNFVSSILQSYPNATVSSSGINPITISVCIPNIMNSSSILVEVSDSACPIIGEASASFFINITGDSFDFIDQTFCSGTQVNFPTSNPSLWTVLSGDNTLGCNNCSNQTLSPSVQTQYAIEMTNSCGLTIYDTLTLTPYSNTVSLPDTIQGNCGSFEIIAGGNDIFWEYNGNSQMGDTLSSDSLLYGWNEIIATSGVSGCASIDTVKVYYDNGSVIINHNGTSICDSGFVQLSASMGTASCNAQAAYVGTADGANGSTVYPAPYANWYRNAKHQFLFLASELQSYGMTAGNISELGWEITQLNGTTTYNAYEIQMGTTATSSLVTWETGLSVVQNAHTRNITVGMNTHVLDNPFYWDGVSNIVVQICYDNLATNYTSNSITPWSNTTFTSSLYFRSDVTAACPHSTGETTSNNRPVTYFATTCDSASMPTISWSPSNAIQNPSSSETATQMGYTGWVYANAQNPVSGCASVDSVEIVANDFIVNLTLSDSIMCDTGIVIGQVSGNYPTNNLIDWTAQGVSYQDSSNSYSFMTSQSGWVIAETGNQWCNGIDSAYIWVSDLQNNVGSISGNNVVLENSTESYVYSPSGNYSFNWVVTGGNISSGQGTNSVDVMWSTGPNAGIAVWVTDTLGCSIDDSLAIQINPVNLNELSKTNIEIYPNPVINELRIQSSDLLGEVSIYTLDGKLIKHFSFNGNIGVLDVSNLEKGVYLLTDVDGRILARFIKE